MNETKDEHCSSSSKDQKWAETCVAGGGVQKARFFLSFRGRRCTFSLGFRVFGPSDRFGRRSKVVLHIEAYTWVPILRSFDKLREVGVSSYLSFTFCLSVL